MSKTKKAKATPAMKHAEAPGHASHGMLMESEMTFAQMLQANRRLIEILKLPPWLFATVCKRKEQSKLTANERSRFICAYNTINANGTLGKIVDVHADSSHRMHGNQRFLPWHRVYLLVLEEALHAIHPDVCIPYWDWTKSANQNFPSWLAGYTPTVVTPTRTINVLRSPGSPASLASIASNTPTALAQNTFGSFTNLLEGIHGAVHVWVGGTMGSVPTAPADPIFWMHHANIDRLWWVWQNSPQGTGKNPSLSGADAIMDPYPTAEPGTRDIHAMGFDYI